ncbi:MAG TPA: carbohydrate ABC transporter permease [Ktedonobacteraceae bacterium]|jgi:multiple sugar transport system permease protein|nr:carbohydrate ABC transporter permease [Ktedonobacteraceae bacterium]
MQAPARAGQKGTFSPTKILTFVVGVVVTVLMLFPVYWMVTNSIKTDAEIFTIPATLVPRQVTFQAYIDTFSTQFPHLVTSLIVSIGTVIISLLLATPAAYALAHFRFRWAPVVIFCMLATQMIPSVTLATPMFLIFNKLGLLNSYLGLILADTTYSVPFDVMILSAFMLSLPYELVEATFVDGAGEWGAFLRVMLPISVPGIVTAGLFAFLFAWGDFLYGLTLMTTNNIQPISLSIYNYLGQFNSQWNNLMAVATLATIPAAIILVACQRYITAGMTSGAVKG